jgi:circadian clock protein KaiC
MNERQRVQIARLASGVPGLDSVLGGGLPQYSFNLIAGGPGTGKTTLAHQIMFALASRECPALYFTVLGEPPLKMLRYQQQFSFFDPEKLEGIIRFVNLSQEVLEQDMGRVLERIVGEVEATSPGIVVVDSFRTVVRTAAGRETGDIEVQGLLQQLALHLTSWQATTFLVGEYQEDETGDSPVFTVADGILWLFQSVERNSIVRKLQVMKTRGQAPMPGLHTFRITTDGIQVFPRIFRALLPEGEARPHPSRRISTGVPGLDEMLGGGIPEGDSVLVAGPSGTGKTVLGTQFIAEGVKQGETGVIIVFEEHPTEYLARSRGLGMDLEAMIRQNLLRVIYLRPLDLSVDETLQEVHDAISQVRAQRVVVDSLSGFELALAPTFRQDFRESLYRMVGALTGLGITVLMTAEIMESYHDLRFSPHAISFLSNDIILLRYVELESQLRKVMTVVKMRGSQHSKDLRAYEITERGLVVGEPLRGYRAIITGVPFVREAIRRPAYPSLTDQEIVVLQALVELQEASTQDVARRTELSRPDVTRALGRLVDLNYAIRATEEGSTVYRLGPGASEE